MTEETPVKSEAENIVEREFASLRSQLEEVEASNAEIKTQYEEALKTIEEFKAAEEERAAKGGTMLYHLLKRNSDAELPERNVRRFFALT